MVAHIYHAHFREIVLLQLHAHLNAIFAHFVEFNLRFNTVEEKEIEVSEIKQENNSNVGSHFRDPLILGIDNFVQTQRGGRSLELKCCNTAGWSM